MPLSPNFDAFPRNLIARHDLAGHELAGHTQTVALDWGSAGVGAVGEELVALFATTLKFFEVEIAQIPRLESLIFTGYLQGLRAAGWQGDENIVRFGFTASVGLKAGVENQQLGYPMSHDASPHCHPARSRHAFSAPVVIRKRLRVNVIYWRWEKKRSASWNSSSRDRHSINTRIPYL